MANLTQTFAKRVKPPRTGYRIHYDGQCLSRSRGWQLLNEVPLRVDFDVCDRRPHLYKRSEDRGRAYGRANSASPTGTFCLTWNKWMFSVRLGRVITTCRGTCTPSNVL